jgi:transcriptional repressor NrdR
MRCPFCTYTDTQVKDSRPAEDNLAIRRRRLCPECGSRFTTFERIQLADLTVIKRNGDRVAFEREKLTKSIATAVSKRPIDPERVEKFINSIIRHLELLGEQEIPTTKIGEVVLESLFNLDKVAYVRFASVYKDFKEPDDFKEFVANLVEETHGKDK